MGSPHFQRGAPPGNARFPHVAFKWICRKRSRYPAKSIARNNEPRTGQYANVERHHGGVNPYGERDFLIAPFASLRFRLPSENVLSRRQTGNIAQTGDSPGSPIPSQVLQACIDIPTSCGASISMAANSNSSTFCEWERLQLARIPGPLRRNSMSSLIDKRVMTRGGGGRCASMLSGVKIFDSAQLGMTILPSGRFTIVKEPARPRSRHNCEHALGRVENTHSFALVLDPEPPPVVSANDIGKKAP